MSKFITPAGVVIEMGNEEAARAVGYKPVGEQVEPEKKAPAKKSASKKSEK